MSARRFIAALWLVSRSLGSKTPWLALALFGFNPAVCRATDALRPYIREPDGEISRRYYELCTLWHLRSALRSGRVWVEHSRRYADPDTYLIPRAALITPNLPEAAALTGIEIRDECRMREAARRLRQMGARSVLVKGGHLAGAANDILLDGEEWYEFPAPRIDTAHTHGTGCAFSAAITAELACGAAIPNAVARAKTYIWEAIRSNPGLGRGSGPVNHHAAARLPATHGY